MSRSSSTSMGRKTTLTLSWATEQYCAAGAILKPLCLSKQLTLCSQQHIDQLFSGHIFVSCLITTFSCNTAKLILHNMCTVIIGFAHETAKQITIN